MICTTDHAAPIFLDDMTKVYANQTPNCVHSPLQILLHKTPTATDRRDAGPAACPPTQNEELARVLSSARLGTYLCELQLLPLLFLEFSPYCHLQKKSIWTLYIK